MVACLDDDLVGALVARRLRPEEATAARHHLDECVDCRLLVGSLARSVAVEQEPTVVDLVSRTFSIHPTDDGGDTSSLVGKVIADKYRILRIIGRGGMGCVVAAEHLQLKTQVALKLLHPHHRVFAEEARVRLGREACAAARVASPYAARVFDVGATEDGMPFMVMELLAGHDLGHELEERGRIEWREAVRWTLQACHALAEAHKNGIVHRDLKPQNIVVLDGLGQRSVKLVDFGISKFLDGDAGEDTSTGEAWIGTPRYMAPEQLKLGHEVDQRTDVWAIGVILHELVSGRHPFERESLKAHCVAVLSEEPASLEAGRAPAGLESVVRRCLAKAPEGRYSSAREVAEALAPWAGAGAVSLLEDMGIVPLRRGSLVSIAPTGRVASKRRYGLGLAALVAVAATSLMAGAMTRSTPRASPPALASDTPESPASVSMASTVPTVPTAAAASSAADVDVSTAPAPVSGGASQPMSASSSRAPRHVAPPRRTRNAEFGGRR